MEVEVEVEVAVVEKVAVVVAVAARHLHTVAVRRMSFATSAAVARLLTRFFMLPNRGIGSTARSASTVFLRPPPGERGLPSAETAAGVDCDVFDFANNLRRASPSGGLLSPTRISSYWVVVLGEEKPGVVLRPKSGIGMMGALRCASAVGVRCGRDSLAAARRVYGYG